MRRTLVIDSGSPCNESQPKSHNLLGFDGRPPNEILSEARANVMEYESVEFVTGEVDSIKRTSPEGVFTVTMSENEEPERIHSRSIILATGVRDVLPTNVPGLSDCWGRSVVHCPYCHGYEFRSKKTALWMNISSIKQMAPILRTTFTDQLCVVGGKEWKNDEDSDELRKQLSNHNIVLHQEPIKEIKHLDGILSSIVLQDGSELPMDCVYIRPPMVQNFEAERLEGESLQLDDKGYIKVDPDTQKTSVEGIMACGDCTTPNRALSIAAAAGTKAAKMLNYELAMDDW